MTLLKTQGDWHRAQVIAALKMKKMSLSQLSRRSGYKSTTLANALDRKWPKGELIIAKALGLTPQEIWPSRY
ncbi:MULTISPECIES: helix-turn-helix domain-containing protein [Serratia]|uniref:helix-turn-helix domain-containing protein n=1 Tax=Serratia TaxID=613 RepID=UPI00094975EB|nr:helix-turn-helix transcriptional regulator [Serratia sp. 506_PEND]